MHHNDQQGSRDVENAHHRNQETGHLCNLLSASADADAEYQRNDAADDPRSDTRGKEAVYLKGIDDIERCHEVKANHIGENHEHSVYNAQLSVVKHAFNVVGRAAVTASVFGAALVNLGQRAFEEGRRAA